MMKWEPTCDSPPPGTNYVGDAKLRPTTDIVWSSLTIIILCTWSILHLNVPIQVRPRNFRERLHRKLYLAGRKLGWMLVALITPEIILGKAIVDRWSAGYSKKRMKEYAERDGVEWEVAHGFFGNMGGWWLKFPNDLPPLASSSTKSNGHRDYQGGGEKEDGTDTIRPIVKDATPPNTFRRYENIREQLKDADDSITVVSQSPVLVRAFTGIVTRMTNPRETNTQDFGEKMYPPEGPFEDVLKWYQENGTRYGDVNWKQNEHNTAMIPHVRIAESDISRLYSKGWMETLAMMQADTWPLDAEQLLLCRQMGLISKLPDLTEDDIEDQSKSDFLVKLVAATQLLWFIIQLIGRATEQLAISQLEIAVLANAGCSLLAYILQLEKPKDVVKPTYLHATRYPTPQELHILASNGPFLYGPKRRSIYTPDNFLHKCLDNRDQVEIFGICATVSAFLFGGLHLLAWNFHFPTKAELWIWRISALIMTLLPSIMISINLYFLDFFSKRMKHLQLGSVKVEFQPVLLGTCSAVFVVCRLAIIVETFRTMAYLEPSAFAATWSRHFPHVGS